MFARPIVELRCHPAQLMTLRALGLVEEVRTAVAPDLSMMEVGPTDVAMPVDASVQIGWRTALGQAVTVSKYLPEEGLFLPDSKAAREAEKTEAGDERRRQALKKYRENHGR